jgi:hypothetical protein
VYGFPTSWLFQACDDEEHKRSQEQNLGAEGRAEMILLTSWASARRREQRESLLWKHFLSDPSWLVFLCTSRSGCMEHPQTQQIDMSPPIHLALEQFEPGDLSFSLPGTPRFGESGLDRRELFLQAQSKAPQFLIGTPFGPLQPGKQGLAFVLPDQANAVLTERRERRKAWGKAEQCPSIGSILCIQIRWLTQQQPFHEDSVFGS